MSRVKTIQDYEESEQMPISKRRLKETLDNAGNTVDILTKKVTEMTGMVTVEKLKNEDMILVAQRLKSEKDALTLKLREKEEQIARSKKNTEIAEKQMTGVFKVITEEEAKKAGEEYVKKHFNREEYKRELEAMFK